MSWRFLHTEQVITFFNGASFCIQHLIPYFYLYNSQYSLDKTTPITSIFGAIPGYNLLLKPVHQGYTVIASSNQFSDIVPGTIIESTPIESVYSTAITGNRQELISVITGSLAKLLLKKQADEIDISNLSIRFAGNRTKKFGSILHTPVLDSRGDVEYIIQTLKHLPHREDLSSESDQRNLEKAYQLFMETPALISLLSGEENILELANKNALEHWNKNESVLGKPIHHAIPELKEQGILKLIDTVRKTGKPVVAKEVPVMISKRDRQELQYFDLIYQPYFEEGSDKASGVFNLSHNVTHLVLARKELAESEQNLKMALEIGGLGVFRIDLLTNRVTYSQQIKEWFDLENNSEERSKMFSRVHPDDIAEISAEVDKTIQSGGDSRYDIIYRVINKKLDKTFYLHSLGQVIVENNIAVGISGIIRDVTEQKLQDLQIEKLIAERTSDLQEARESLQNFNGYLQRVINIFNTPLQVLAPVYENGEIVDFTFRITNAAYAAYGNTTPEKIQHMKVGDIFPGYFQTSSFTKVVEVFKTGEPETWEIHYNADGLDIYNMMSAKKMDDEVIVHFYDFSKQKLLQIDLEKKIAELERSNRNLEEFAHAASHDLKEPIRKVQVFTEQLKEQLGQKLQPNELHAFNRIENSTKRMGHLVDDLLQYSHVSHRPHKKEQVNVNEKIRLVMEDLELDIQQKNAQISVGDLPVVKGYRRQLQQLFQNLISNALKYCKADEPPQIRISAKREMVQGREYHQIEISDNGIGFEPEYADKIFQIFIRLHSKTAYSGTGIGLSIAKKVVENHEGFITAESQPGVGTTFRVLLPV